MASRVEDCVEQRREGMIAVSAIEGQIEIIGNISARLIGAGLMIQDMALRSSGMGFIAGHVATTPRRSHSRWTETLSGYVSYLSNGRLLWINQLT